MSERPRPFLHPLLNEREVAALLGVSVRTVQEWRQSGQGPPFLKLSSRKRGAVRYDPADVQAYMTRRRVRSTAQGGDLVREHSPDSRVRRR